MLQLPVCVSVCASVLCFTWIEHAKEKQLISTSGGLHGELSLYQLDFLLFASCACCILT
jgi:hypothetical protein